MPIVESGVSFCSVREAVGASMEVATLVFINGLGSMTVAIHISYPVDVLFASVAGMLNVIGSFGFGTFMASSDSCSASV